jgi:hypothetical protein
MLVGRCSEPDPDGPLGPGNRVGLHEFLDAVLPEDPGSHARRDGRGADRELTRCSGVPAAQTAGSSPTSAGPTALTTLTCGEPRRFT